MFTLIQSFLSRVLASAVTGRYSLMIVGSLVRMPVCKAFVTPIADAADHAFSPVARIVLGNLLEIRTIREGVLFVGFHKLLVPLGGSYLPGTSCTLGTASITKLSFFFRRQQ